MELPTERDMFEHMIAGLRAAAHICAMECECGGEPPVLATTAAGNVAVIIEGSPEAIAEALLPRMLVIFDRYKQSEAQAREELAEIAHLLSEKNTAYS